MDLLQNLLIPISTGVIVIAFLITLVMPVLPGTIIIWAIAMATAVLDGFDRVTTPALIVMTMLMVVSASSDVWLPIFGIKTDGLSCLSALAAFLGGIGGTFLIPIPIVGTLVGTVGGALIVEYLRGRQLDRSVKAGREALKLFFIGYVVRTVTSLLVIALFLFSIATTG